MKITIDVQEGHGPYLWIIGWREDEVDMMHFVVHSHYEDARGYANNLIRAGHEIPYGPSLASNFSRMTVDHFLDEAKETVCPSCDRPLDENGLCVHC